MKICGVSVPEQVATGYDTISWSFSLLLDNSVNFNDGDATFSLTAVDLASNPNVLTNYDANNTVLIDRTQPILSSITISGSNDEDPPQSHRFAGVGDTATLTIQTNEAIESPTGTWYLMCLA